MRRQLGIRRRLLLAVLAAVTVGVAGSTAIFNVVLRQRLDQEGITRARTSARAVRDALQVEDGRIVRRNLAQPAEVGTSVWIFGPGRVLLAPRVGRDLTEAASRLAGGPERTERVGEEARLYSTPVVSGGRRIGAVVAGISLRGNDRTLDAALIASLVFAAVVVAGVAAASWWLLGRALRLVARMTADAESWSAADLHHRFALGVPHDEITQLGATLDHLFARIEAALLHEQRFAAELSHELRTPLAAVTAELELARARERTANEYRAALDRIELGAQQMTRTIDALVAAARHEWGLTQQTADASNVVSTAAQGCAALARSRDVRIAASDPAERIAVPIEAALLERILHPVLDNACRHAARLVQVTLERRAGAVRILVADDGPGVDPADRERIFRPGERATAGGGGAGLGLPLARRLARSAGGDVTVESATSGGCFVIELPAL